jgi:antitoxin MazE
MYLHLAVDGRGGSLSQSKPLEPSAAEGRHFQQAIRRWGNSLAVRLPSDCLRQAGLQEGDQIEIVVDEDGRLSLKPLRQLDRSALAADLRRLQATMPLTRSVIEQCRADERW